jgi:hypothetical protein
VQQANKLTSDKVAAAFLFHPTDVSSSIATRSPIRPKAAFPGLVDLDRATVSAVDNAIEPRIQADTHGFSSKRKSVRIRLFQLTHGLDLERLIMTQYS